jgi:hypothetical protein
MLLELSVGAQDNVASSLSASPKAAAHTPPPPPAVKAPVELFRSLLDMAPAERREFLANRSPEAQKMILAKVHEYEAFKPEERKLRLHVTELRWYLLPLFSASSTNRSKQLAAIPAGDLRDQVEARLKQWDALPREVQKELLDNEATIRFYFELAARTPAQRTMAVTNLAPTAQVSLDSGIRRWQALSEEQRQSVVRNFYQFFNLTPAERDKTLRTLSETERMQIERTLSTYEGLSTQQRAQCLKSFQKFASMSPEERQQFLKNAQRWERMTPSERQSWKYLVSNLSRQPPMPPGLQPPMPPTQPTGGTARTAAPASSLLTNTN